MNSSAHWLQHSRVGREVQTVFFSIFGGGDRSLWLAVVTDAAMIVALLVLLGFCAIQIGLPLECVQSCLASDVVATCCMSGLIGIVAALAVLLCWLSYHCSRRRNRSDRTLHSALLSVLLMLPAAIWLALSPVPWWMVVSAPVVGIFAMFIGYRWSYRK